MRWCLAAITWLCLTACTTVKPNSEQPILVNIFIIIISGLIIANTNPQDVDCRGLKMAINPNLVGVPAQSKNLDTATTTTTAGLVHRQVISLADPETATNYARVSGGSLQVSVQNATLAVTQSGTFNITNISGTVSLPTGASTATLQTTETQA